MSLPVCIRAAVAGEGLSHVFQPIWDLRRGSLLGFEALARFSDGTPPGLAWQAAQAMGLGPQLDRMSVSRALAAGSELPELLFFNVSAGTLSSTEAPRGVVRSAIQRHGRQGRCVVEVTEDAMDVPAAAQQRLDVFARLGLPVALDDAGAEGSTPARLALLGRHLGFIKLDRCLVRRWSTGGCPDFDGWLAIAARANVPCIAEGVEERGLADALAAAGILGVQGFAFGVPAPASHWTPGRLARLRPGRPAAARPGRVSTHVVRSGPGR